MPNSMWETFQFFFTRESCQTSYGWQHVSDTVSFFKAKFTPPCLMNSGLWVTLHLFSYRDIRSDQHQQGVSDTSFLFSRHISWWTECERHCTMVLSSPSILITFYSMAIRMWVTLLFQPFSSQWLLGSEQCFVLSKLVTSMTNRLWASLMCLFSLSWFSFGTGRE